VLQLVSFKVGEPSTLDEIIEESLKKTLEFSKFETQSEIPFTEEIKNKAFLMGLMLSIAQEIDKPYNKSDVAAATIYMTIKLLEK